MKYNIISKSSTQELIDLVRTVPLLSDPAVQVYENSNISIKEFYPEELNLAKLSFIKSNIERTKQLREDLITQHNIDILNLDFRLEFQNENEKSWVIIPPIVELSPKAVQYVPKENEEDPNRIFENIKIPILGDGAHRGFVAKELGVQIKVVFISNADPKYPYYAYPNDWSEAEIAEETVAKEKRKYFVWEDKYSLFRDFSVISTGGVRETGSKGY